MKTMTRTTILVLMSDPIMRPVVQETLENEGYTVLPAADLGTAVDRLKEMTPDLLIIRSYVESIPGYEAARYLRTKCPGIRVLMVGGLMDDDRLRHPMMLAKIDIFPKPFTAASLIEKVKEVLNEPL